MTNASFTIIDQQSDFIIVDKPAGTNFHDEGEIGEGFFNAVKSALALSELYPVHRLDKMTSGLVIFAKTLNAAQQFQQLFEAHQIQKFYLALSDKKPKKKQGLIKGDMAKSRRSAWKLLRSTNNPAVTQFISYGLGNGLRLFVVKPHSGKTHQIRVALNSVGSPIIGDDIYYPSATEQRYDRGYLHAYALQFSLNGQSFNYIKPPAFGEHFSSQNVVDVLEKIAEPWQLSWPKL